MDTPETEREKDDFEAAFRESFKSPGQDSVQDSQRRLLMEFYAMGRRHERNSQKGPVSDV